MSISNNFLPSVRIIENITRSFAAIVTTTTPHGYDDSLLVRIVLPSPTGVDHSFGMESLNNRVFKITVIDDTHFRIQANTRNDTPFTPIIDPVPAHQYPQVIPVAETGYSFTEAVRNNNNIVPET